MNEFLKMDIFFVVTTVAVVCIAAACVVSFVYFIRILRNVERISEEVEEETKLFRADIHDARSTVRKNGKLFGKQVSATGKALKRLFAAAGRKS